MSRQNSGNLLSTNQLTPPLIEDDLTLEDKSRIAIGTTLRPGQKGTLALLKSYGEQLICVRYRYDKARGKRYKTVELIIEEQEWLPCEVIQRERYALIRIGIGETELRERVKTAGGYWSTEERAWVLPHRKVLELGLERHVAHNGMV